VTIKGNNRDSGYERDPYDFYVEDVPCVVSFFEAGGWFRPIVAHDPCCGNGNIPSVAASLGIEMTGADLINRAAGRYPVRDFLADEIVYPNIITNPPYKIAEEIIRHALSHVHPGGLVAALVMEKFLYSQGRQPLFALRECEKVLILSRRPSMPPGKLLAEKGEACRGGGFANYAWVVWRVGKAAPGASIAWLP